MNTVYIWIGIPLLLALALIFLRRWSHLCRALLSIACLALVLLALLLPRELVLSIGLRVFVFETDITFFGRVLRLDGTDLPLVAVFYLLCGFWNLLAPRWEENSLFPGLTLLITALWLGALNVEPFLYAAIVIELLVLLGLFLLSAHQGTIGKGGLRYLVLQSIAVPLIVLSGWLLSSIELAPSANPLILRASLLVLLGFALWMAVFSLHSWIPMLCGEGSLWSFSFLQTVAQFGFAVLFLSFLQEYYWLRNLPHLKEILLLAGVVSVFFAGSLAVFQNDVARLLAYALLLETGCTLIAISLAQEGGIYSLVMSFLPRALLSAQWSLSLEGLSALRPGKGLTFQELRGIGRRYPFLSLGLILSILGFLGLPLLANYPARRNLWNLLQMQQGGYLVPVCLGLALFLVAFLRLFFAMMRPAEDAVYAPEGMKEDFRTKTLVILMLLLNLSMGLFPQVFWRIVQGLIVKFSDLLL